MARIKIELPQNFIFKTRIPVRVTDLNYGEHVGNDTILGFMHEARMQFLTNWGFDEGNIMGPGLIMADVAISYKAEIFYGTTLEILITPGVHYKKGFELFYLIREVQSQKEFARGQTGLVFFDYTTRKTAFCPGALENFWAKQPIVEQI